MKRILSLTLFMILGAALAQSGIFDRLAVDTERANISVGEVMSGGPPPQGIPAIGFRGDWQGQIGSTRDPVLVSQEEAADWLDAQEPVIALEIGGEARAYPLQILTWHEIANDTLGGKPIAVTFCPLCNSAFTFDRRIPLTSSQQDEIAEFNQDAEFISLDDEFLSEYERQWGDADVFDGGVEATFGVSGMLYKSNMLMFDDSTSTLYAQILGEGNVGTLTETRLLRYPTQIVSFAEFREAHPNGDVLSRDTGFNRDYGRNPYVGYDRADQPPFLFQGETDGRLPPKARVIAVEIPEQVAYPFEVLEQNRVVNDTIGETPVVAMWQEGTASALDQASISGSKDVGAVGIFERTVGGENLTFAWDGEAFVDEETGSRWNLLGRATAGELEGTQLTPVLHDNTLWFAWAAFMPATRVYRAE